MTADAPRGRSFPKLKRRVIGLAVIVGIIWVLKYAVQAFVSIDTNLLWFRSIAHESVYTRTFWTQALLFAIFGALMAATVAFNLVVFHRSRPEFTPDPVKQRWRYQFSKVESRLRKWLFIVIVGYFTITMGSRAASNWQTWLQWRHPVAFHAKDPQFHRDLSYYVFIYPMHRLVLTLLFRIVGTAIVVLLVSAYAYGAIKPRGPKPRITPAVRAQLSFLLGSYLVLKAFAYWLDRYGLTTSNRGVVTGAAYTDIHAILPGRIVLIVIAAIAAALLFLNTLARSNRLLLIGIGLMAFGALVIGVAWPAVLQQFREKPAASQVELPSIQNNIAATRNAFGINKTVTTMSYPGNPKLSGTPLAEQAAQDAQIRVLDPNQLSPTFNVKQQVQGFYGFKNTLDVDHYLVAGQNQDVLIGLRELTLSGLPSQSWTNVHIVYTHGYGVVAAPTDKTNGPLPNFVARDLPPTGAASLVPAQSRIYYGQMSPSYSIVGAPPGAKPKEFDLPSNGLGASPRYTHTGGGGVPIGSLFHRLLYSVKLNSASILFSGEINKDSQLLTIRNPRARVAAVAPWLTLDGDTYPTVVNGHILWVVDGYTTSSNYPDSQLINLRSATSNTLVKNGSTVTQPSTSINYMQNSVKATVDAYSGQVTLYAWNQAAQPDPILSSWEKSFPGLIKPQSDIPAALLPHLRYPQDLFNVQRSLLTTYHVTNAAQYYAGSNFWTIPNDPTIAPTTTKNSLGKTVTTSAPNIPSVYMSLAPTGYGPATYSLSTPLVTLNQLDLAAFLSVDSEPGPNYGKMTLLELPPGQSDPSPSQIQNELESDQEITNDLSLSRTGSSQVVEGNLLTIPLAGDMLFVEPIYTQSTNAGYPLLRHVVVIYGNGKPAFKDTLSAALNEALGVTVPLPQASGTVTPTTPTPASTTTPTTSTGGSTQ